MKMPHNYITPLPPKKEQELFLWYTYSVYLLAGLIILLLGINGYQLWQVRAKNNSLVALQTTLQELQKNVAEQEGLKQKKMDLELKLNFLENLTKQDSGPREIMGLIEQAIPADACLTELSYHNNGELALHGYAQTAETALLFLRNLQATAALKNLELASLAPVKFQEHDKTWYQFYMKVKKAQKNAPAQEL